MKYLLISVFFMIGVGSMKLDENKHNNISIDINNTSFPSGEVTDINPNPPDTTTIIPTTTSPAVTTTKPVVTTTPTPKPTTLPPTSSSTDNPSNKTTPQTTPSTSSTVKPSVSTTTVPVPEHHRRFDGPSFVGGIVLALGLVAIGFVAFKFYKARTELNYHTL